MDKMTLVKIPRMFVDDHAERDLDTPEIVQFSKTHYWIKRDDPAVDELLSDANWHADPDGPGVSYPGLRVAARALIRAMTKS